MSRKLIVLAGPDEGRVFPLDADNLLLGRSRATGTALIDPNVSRVHCQVQVEDSQVVLTDFDSESGTFVNGQRIGRHVLHPGDLIRIGRTSLQYTDVDAVAAPPSSPAQVPMATPVGTQPVAPVPRSGSWVEAVVGQKLGNYKVGSLLAKGRHGFVFHGRDTRRNLPVVLKVFGTNYIKDEAVSRFTQAMKAVLPLRHPHLLKVYGAGKTGEHCWIAKEYVRGESLAAVIHRVDVAGRIDWRNVLRVGIYLTRALDYSHSKKLIHQCVTPFNILLGKTPQETKLSDLMVAAAIEDDALIPITPAGIPSESLSYQSPERTERGATVDVRTDIYSLGATLYAMLAGRPPLQGSSIPELVEKIRTETPVRFDTLGLTLPTTLQTTVFKMMAKRPDDRFPAAREVLGPLVRLAKEEHVTF